MKGYVNEEINKSNVKAPRKVSKKTVQVIGLKEMVGKKKTRTDYFEGSKNGFIFGLFGGILNLLVGLGVVIWVLVSFVQQSNANNVNKVLLISLLGVALYLLILGVWILASSYWMKREKSLKKGAVTCLVLGIMSVNPLAIVGGVIGRGENNKRDSGMRAI